MAEIYRMPAISPTMEVGSLVEWRLAEGQPFEVGTILADVGTDKANMEAEIFDEGVLLKHLVAEGDEFPVDYPIAILGSTAGEDIADLLAQARSEQAAMAAGAAAEPTAAPSAATPPAPAAAPAPRPEAAPLPIVVGRSWMGKALPSTFMEPPGDIRAASQPGRHVASPLARRIAADEGLDITRLKGSGPGGRVVRADVEQALKAPKNTGGFARPDDEVKRNSPMRKTIARRLLQSHTDIPVFFLTVDLDMAAFVSTRAMLKTQLPDVKISYNDMLVAAVARSLRAFPQANASWSDKAITRHGRVDVGVAVALPDGLITPTLRDADRMTLSEIASTTRELAGRAREGKLLPEEYTGATFTVSNLGMMGIEEFTAIINPPESAILAVGAIRQEAVVESGRLAIGHRMKVTMSCDHRVLDGMVGAQFLKTLRKYVENPFLLLV